MVNLTELLIQTLVLPKETKSNFTDYNPNLDRKAAIALLIYGVIFKIIVIIIVMTLGKMIWNNVLTAMIPALAPTSAFGIFALWFFIGLMMM